MAFKKKTVTITCSSNAGSGTVAAGATYGRLCQFRGYGGTGTVDITLTDADGADLFVGTTLDVLGTVTANNTIGNATTAKPLKVDGIDQTGAAEAAGGTGPIFKSPITVTLANATGATDTITLDLFVEV